MEEPFNGEYFQHLLASLTLNSRALIVELTGIAEKYPDDAPFMVDTIEERINKILPKYKLYLFYLMDLIIKNIGNPYNLLFSKNIFKLFTETYLIVDDTTTRQNLINLFKTWMGGKTSAGLDLFPQEMLLRIEKFIIRATSLGLAEAQPHAGRISRDVILREGNYLLQYIIGLDEDLERIVQEQTSDGNAGDDSLKIADIRLARNAIIFEINGISERVMVERKEDFDARKDDYLRRLQEMRKMLDLQSQAQGLMKGSPAEPTNTPMVPEPPREIALDTLFGTDGAFAAFVQDWGKPSISTPLLPPTPAETPEEAPNPSQLASSLGIDIGMSNFDEYNSSVSTADNNELDLDDDDGYDPESTIIEEKHSPPTSPIHSGVFKSSLKRPASGEHKAAKKVRFNV